VLVTGGSGFVGSHCILDLLSAGYSVRTTVRSPDREATVRELLGAESADALTFATADLTGDAGWSDAVSGCDFVLHVASPFPLGPPKHEDDLIVPAREGALRVLRAARDAGVKRVVMTSSFAAIGYGQPPPGRPFTEEDWTDPGGGGVGAYAKSKTLAERAAWDFVEREGGGLELSVVNPVGVFGPVLGSDFSTSIELVKRLLDGSVPGIPRVSYGIVDVRDVASLHRLAMAEPAGAGERFLAVAGDFMTVADIAALLRERLGPEGEKVPTRMLPNWVVRAVSVFDSSVKQIVPELGKEKQASNAKARRVLGWAPRSNEEAILASAESLLRLRRTP
jgi:nucleoside-diphosphate-sugar epimerase